ncbi:Cytochrome c oxidase assembly protein cox18, mitochondrial [Orbilia brochopaga]|uniref:Cytochrome c oxidase assembly protein cox18, mitochondrial n=1 Tax=Orbilia brochopaga TaxID=3140254 RepID=A0AAV9U376_9PEZI
MEDIVFVKCIDGTGLPPQPAKQTSGIDSHNCTNVTVIDDGLNQTAQERKKRRHQTGRRWRSELVRTCVGTQFATSRDFVHPPPRLELFAADPPCPCGQRRSLDTFAAITAGSVIHLSPFSRSPTVIPHGFNDPNHHLPRYRDFSTSSTITSLFDSVQSLILQLHDATSLPWLFTIPLVAVIAPHYCHPPFSLYAHRPESHSAGTLPVAACLDSHPSPSSRKGSSPIDPIDLYGTCRTQIYDTPQKWQREVLQRTQRTRRQLYRQFGCQAWKSYVGLAQIPVWILASVSVRRLAGVGNWWSAQPSAAPIAALTTENADDDATAAASIDADPSTTLENANITDEIIGAVRTQMQHDGIDGWFTDLLQPDPMFILPIIFSLAVFTNIATVHSTTQHVKGWRKGLRNGLWS